MGLPRAIGASKSAKEMKLAATGESEHFAQTDIFRTHSLWDLRPLVILLAVALSGCGDKPPQPAAAAAPPVTVAQPVKRTVTNLTTGAKYSIEG